MEQQTRPKTISDLAAVLGVSPMTVHRAISGKPDISARTRERILAEVERIGWRPNIAARGLRKGKTFTLGIVVSNVAASFLPEVLQGVNRAAEELGYHTFVSVHEHDPARAIRHLQTLQSKGVDGIVYYPTPTGEELETLQQIQMEMPLVVVMRDLPEFEGCSVTVDEPFGGAIAANHLADLGHRAVGFLGYEGIDFSRLRFEGFRSRLRERGVELPAEFTVDSLIPGEPETKDMVSRLLRSRPRPTALFCVSDRIAAWALRAAHEEGLQVPRDLSILGYNNDPLTELVAVPLTTVAQPRRQVGQEAARLVLTPEDEAEIQPARVILRPRLVPRESTAPAQ